MDFRNRTALITGASGGIGEEFARQLAGLGANLILVARRADKLAELRTTLLMSTPGIEIDVLAADLSLPGSGAQLAAQIGDLGRQVDILINNAGVGSHGDFVDLDPEALAAQIHLNCGSLVDLTARFLPAMVKARKGLVINVASTAAFQPTPTMAVYGATKAFVRSFTEALWQETKGTGVRVLTLCPGATETEFFARTGKQFMTRGRQTARQVVDTALAFVDKSGPTVISGLVNTVLAVSTRLLPSRVLAPVSQLIMKES
ncbi:MAG: SDR family oxidoreductase [Mycolicibacterium cosmeticum]|nr:SDR family oxidoreductase [Mycolicibacterium cosmeticum]